MKYLKRFNEGFEGDKVVSDLNDIFIAWQDNYDTNVVIKKWPKGEGPGLENKGKVDKLFGVGENDTVIKVSVSLNQQAVWDGKELMVILFEDEIKMSLDYLEELTDGEIDFYFIIDHQFGKPYCDRIDDMRNKLEYFNEYVKVGGGNLIEMYFIERG